MSKSGMPGRGNFGWQPLVSTFEPTLEDMMSNRSYFGMPPEAVYLWGSLRDENGEIYSPMRRIPAGLPTDARDTRRRFYLITSSGYQDGMYVHPVGRESAPNDGFTKNLEDGRVHWRSHPAAPNPFHMTWSPEECSWREGDAMDIRGKLVKPGMHWYLPGGDAAMYYVANIFEMEGTILGNKVRGFIGFDPIYMYEGAELYKTKDAMVQEALEVVWYTWATRYKDGSLDAGHFTLGNDMFGFAILTNENGEVRFTYDVNGSVNFDAVEGYWHEGIRYTAFGEEWEFLPDPKGRMIGLGKLKNPQVDGRWRRVGDTREPEFFMAWGETAPSHGSRPTNRFPKLGTRIGVDFMKY